MMSHELAYDLLPAFSLDAVDRDEHEQIEVHLDECPRCRAELDAYRDVAAALGNSVESLPDALWASIAGRLTVSKRPMFSPNWIS
jgi:predicted anti-sigma-YlaC factor YlaD